MYTVYGSALVVNLTQLYDVHVIELHQNPSPFGSLDPL